MITLDNLTYSYHKGFNVLSDISTQITPGIHLLLGENGAGKTTFLHIIGGLLNPRSGECKLDEENIALRNPSTLRRIGFLGENMDFPAKTIKEMANIHGCFFPNFNNEMLEKNLALFGLRSDYPLQRMSLGNRHKAQLAYMLALQQDVLLLDEPANGLDIASKQTFCTMMAQCVNEQQIVIISTHTVWDLQNLFDNIIVISGGELLINQPIEKITARLAFKASFQTPENAIFTEQRFGLIRSITENTTEAETELDFTLLYNALMSPARQNIIGLLNNKTENIVDNNSETPLNNGNCI